MIIIVACGTSTHTSITVVETKTCIFHLLKSFITLSLSFEDNFQCINHTLIYHRLFLFQSQSISKLLFFQLLFKSLVNM